MEIQLIIEYNAYTKTISIFLYKKIPSTNNKKGFDKRLEEKSIKNKKIKFIGCKANLNKF